MLLAALLPNDLGEDSPNAANYFQLRNVGLDKFSNYVTELGHPYRWTQQMAGLNFLSVKQEGGRNAEQVIREL
jgi:THO complex subunit 5